MEIRAFEILCYSAFIRFLGSSINLEISTSGSQARNRHTQSQHRMGRRPMHSSGISELRIRDVLTRVLPQRGHFIRSRSSEPESLFQLGLVSPAASIAEAETPMWDLQETSRAQCQDTQGSPRKPGIRIGSPHLNGWQIASAGSLRPPVASSAPGLALS